MRFGFELKGVLMLPDHMSGPGETDTLVSETLARTFKGTVVRAPFLGTLDGGLTCAPAPPY